VGSEGRKGRIRTATRTALSLSFSLSLVLPLVLSPLSSDGGGGGDGEGGGDSEFRGGEDRPNGDDSPNGALTWRLEWSLTLLMEDVCLIVDVVVVVRCSLSMN